MSPVTIRAGRAEDLEALLALEASFPGDRLTRRGLARLLRVPSAAVRVACRDESVIGALILLFRRGSGVARIYSLAVADAARRGGVAAQLLESALACSRDRGCREIRLEVREDNEPARRFYARHGFETRCTLPAYYEDGGDGLRLRRILGE